MSIRLELGDCRKVLPTLPEASVQCVVTSPPYWGLRDYGVEGQLGLEATPEEYLARMVEVFRAVRRVLRADGTCWCNMGDGYLAQQGLGYPGFGGRNVAADPAVMRSCKRPAWLKPKDLVGMPWRLAFALQADGWFLRADIVWAKPNPMPESVTDRPTKAHEYVFLLTKSARYFYDADAVREPATRAGDLPGGDNARGLYVMGVKPHHAYNGVVPTARNLRSVWTIAPEPYPEAHFATFAPELARRCIVAGTSAKGCCAACGAPWVREVAIDYRPSTRGAMGQIGDARRNPATRIDLVAERKTKHVETTGWHPTCDHDAAVVPCTVLDPFAGSGTVGEVAERNGRDAVLIELSPAYVELARVRTAQRSLFATPDAIGAP